MPTASQPSASRTPPSSSGSAVPKESGSPRRTSSRASRRKRRLPSVRTRPSDSASNARRAAREPQRQRSQTEVAARTQHSQRGFLLGAAPAAVRECPERADQQEDRVAVHKGRAARDAGFDREQVDLRSVHRSAYELRRGALAQELKLLPESVGKAVKEESLGFESFAGSGCGMRPPRVPSNYGALGRQRNGTPARHSTPSFRKSSRACAW